MTEIDCLKCRNFDIYQDTDDEGRAIAPPIDYCSKGHEVFPTSCNDFEEWVKEYEINIVLTDDFGRVMTRVKTKLSPPELMDKIMELEEIE